MWPLLDLRMPHKRGVGVGRGRWRWRAQACVLCRSGPLHMHPPCLSLSLPCGAVGLCHMPRCGSSFRPASAHGPCMLLVAGVLAGMRRRKAPERDGGRKWPKGPSRHAAAWGRWFCKPPTGAHSRALVGGGRRWIEVAEWRAATHGNCDRHAHNRPGFPCQAHLWLLRHVLRLITT